MAAGRNGAACVVTNAESGRALASNLRRQFYWPRRMAGAGGGGIFVKLDIDSIPRQQYRWLIASPTGFQKERMSAAREPYLRKPPNCTGRDPLFVKSGCYHYLFDAAMRPQQAGLDFSNASCSLFCYTKGVWTGGQKIHGLTKAVFSDNYAAGPSRKCIVLDIEGTTTPISFVTDVLFPYANNNVRKHLNATYESDETKDDIMLLREQVKEDLEQGIDGSVPIPPDDAGKEAVIDSLVANVEAMIKADRKITALKQLQGHIWRTGFEGKELQSVVFEDVPGAFKRWHAKGIKVYIYSSGSREAQRLIFGNTAYGDLRKYLCGFFDTMMGNKKESRSYFEIWQSVGVDQPSQILFLTDVFQEAVAAKAAGLEVIISLRPGNGPLPENHGFRTVESFTEI